MFLEDPLQVMEVAVSYVIVCNRAQKSNHQSTWVVGVVLLRHSAEIHGKSSRKHVLSMYGRPDEYH